MLSYLNTQKYAKQHKLWLKILLAGMTLSASKSLFAQSEHSPTTLKRPTSKEVDVIQQEYNRVHASELAELRARTRIEKMSKYVALATNTRNANLIYMLSQLELTPEEAIEGLNPILREENNDFKIASMRVLAKFESKASPIVPIVSKYLSVPELQHVAAQTIASIGPAAKDAVPALIAELERGTPNQVFNTFVFALGKIGPSSRSSLPVLKKLESVADTKLAYEIFIAVGEIESVPPIDPSTLKDKRFQAFKENDPHAAFAALSALPKEDAIPILRELLSVNAPLSWQVEALTRVAKLKVDDPNVLKLLFKHASSKDLFVSQRAAIALQNFIPNDPSVIAVLSDYIIDDDDSIAALAATILTSLKSDVNATPAIKAAIQAIPLFTDRTSFMRIRETLTFLRMQGPKASDASKEIQPLLSVKAAIYTGRSQNVAEAIRTEAMATIAETGVMPECLPAILDLLANSGHPGMYAAAAKAAGNLPESGDRTVPLLMRALTVNAVNPISTRRWGDMVGSETPRHEKTSAAIESIKALAKIGPPKAKAAIPALQKLVAARIEIPEMTFKFQDEAKKAIEVLSK